MEPDTVASDLVEYLIVEVPDLGALANLVPALVELVASAKIRILDLVALETDADGSVAVLEVDAIDSMTALRSVDGDVGCTLSQHDIELVSLALRPGTSGIVLVTEDRWTEPLAVAARRAGGQILGGERIPAVRVASVSTSRRHRADLLARPPCGIRAYEEGVRAWFADPVDQLEELADLLGRGLLSREEFEHHKAKVIDS